jgi:hypothetical protein
MVSTLAAVRTTASLDQIIIPIYDLILQIGCIDVNHAWAADQPNWFVDKVIGYHVRVQYPKAETHDKSRIFVPHFPPYILCTAIAGLR